MNTALLKGHYQTIQKTIQTTLSKIHSKSQVTLIVVSKKRTLDQIEALYHLGQRDFGENYLQELREKASQMHQKGYHDLRWHFIGHLQTNKVKALLPWVHTIHTIDSIRLLRELVKQLETLSRPPLPIFLEINLNEESSKSGIIPKNLPLFLEESRDLLQTQRVDFKGLMCIPNPKDEPRHNFIQLRELEHSCQPLSKGMLSMGMSKDFITAIEEGATHIRLGQILFEENPPP